MPLPSHVQAVLDALTLLGASSPGVDEDPDAGCWRMSWSAPGWYAEIEVSPAGVVWFANGSGGVADYGGSSAREPGPVPDALCPWLSRFGVIPSQ